MPGIRVEKLTASMVISRCMRRATSVKRSTWKPSMPPPSLGMACGAKVPSTPVRSGGSLSWANAGAVQKSAAAAMAARRRWIMMSLPEKSWLALRVWPLSTRRVWMTRIRSERVGAAAIWPRPETRAQGRAGRLVLEIVRALCRNRLDRSRKGLRVNSEMVEPWRAVADDRARLGARSNGRGRDRCAHVVPEVVSRRGPAHVYVDDTAAVSQDHAVVTNFFDATAADDVLERVPGEVACLRILEVRA